MSLIGFKARNHPQHVVKGTASLFPGLADPTDSQDDRWTPGPFFDACQAEFGFTLDVAASDDNHKCGRWFTLETDGLAQSWAGERIWCNPPFSDIRPWVAKAHEETGALVVMLLPANRTEQPWWQQYVEPHRDRGGRLTVRFLAGRLRFVRSRDAMAERGNCPPFGCCLLIWEAVAG